MRLLAEPLGLQVKAPAARVRRKHRASQGGLAIEPHQEGNLFAASAVMPLISGAPAHLGAVLISIIVVGLAAMPVGVSTVCRLAHLRLPP